ncbi:MAG: hypothetical protein AAGK17_02895 [Pseudomonadota bacterium]
MSDPCEAFKEEWLPKLSSQARIAIEHGQIGALKGTHCDVADGFVSMLGLKPIGFNWELLDAAGDAGEPRSAFDQIVEALSHDIANPSRPWLPSGEAQRCARAFIELFEPSVITIVSNRYDGLWNPIAGAANEWGFVAYDAQRIALFLIAER